MAMSRSLRAMLIIPTGVGAAIGGYAGDGLPVARAIAAVVDDLITHPNVLNGASLYWSMANVHYVEGYALDQFALGAWGLCPVHSNRIGVIFDLAIEPELAARHHQVIRASRATLGLNIVASLTTDHSLGVGLQVGTTATWGTITQPDSLLRAADQLITQHQVEAIAVIARFPDDLGSLALQNYRQGHGVDPIAGAEAVISHLISREFMIPCAHAPALSPLPLDLSISDRACAEEIGYTFLPCVLVGLSRAPKLVEAKLADLTVADLDLAIAPWSGVGGAAVLALAAQNLPLILVKENQTSLEVMPQSLGVRGICVENYLEAIGVIAAIKAGINPQTLCLSSLQR
ncbi:MAG: DUF3326 domain-containing protein [Pseudanabaenaceae cyanobacterium bins.68]|nr:DUF3326 domain-containing protein [Pseudanabaenaceae cyanobacterium bins.68]